MTRLENDLISRKALLEEVKLIGNQPLPDVRTLKDLEQAIVNTYHAILNQITNAPTIEADSGEPVAWYREGNSINPKFIEDINKANETVYIEFRMSAPPANRGWLPLYTSPPKREWINLDPFEVDALINLPLKDDIELAQLVRKIQARLKELNHG